MCTLAPVVAEQAGLPLTPFYRYLLAMREYAPVYTAGNDYMDAAGATREFGEDAALDEITIGGTTLNKYTQVRFRSGIYSYRMAAIDADILDAVTVKPNVEEEE